MSLICFANELRDRLTDFVRGILLDEVFAFNRDFFLMKPGPAEITCLTRQNCAGFSVDK
jgi:hypothetical protein